MATEVRHRRGTTAQHATFTGAIGEITVDTDKDTVVVHDGITVGGFPLLTVAASTATAIINTPSGNISATTVQAAINELDTEKAKLGANSDITSLTGLTTPVSLIALRSYLSGCTLSTVGSSTTMGISAGVAMDSTNSYLMQLSAIAKTTGAWAVGTAAGGIDTGTIANNTGYHFFVIRRPDTGVVDALLSLSATAPTMPANYTQFRRIGWGRTNGSAQWTSFVQDGDFFQWAAPTVDVNLVSAGTAAATRTLTVPTGVNVRAVLNAQMSAGGGGEILYISDLAVTDQAPTTAATSPINTMFTGASTTTSAQVMVRTNISGQVRTRQAVGGATETFRMATVGWFDTRGKDQ